MFKIISIIFLFILTLSGTGLSFDKMEIPISSLFGENLFTDNQSKILFVDGVKGLYSIDLTSKKVNRIGEYKMVTGIYSTPQGIFLIYNQYNKSKRKGGSPQGVSPRLSVLGDGYHEVFRREYTRWYGHAYPMAAPDGKHIALTEYIATSGSLDLIIIDADGKEEKHVSSLESKHTLPTFLWSDDSNLLYLLRSNGNNTEFSVYDIRNGTIKTIHDEANMEVFYTFPKLLNNRHILFLGKDSNGGLIIGRYDLMPSLTTVKKIDMSDDYDDFMMSISELPDNLYLCEAVRAPDKHKLSVDKHTLILFDDSLEIKKVIDITAKNLTPIAYNRMLKGMLFFRNERELIGMDFGREENGQPFMEVIVKK